MRTLHFLALIALLAITATEVTAQSCRIVRPIGSPPYKAEDYPLPLSLRINLIRLVKRELAAIDRYNDPQTVSDGVFHDLLENEIKRMQSERGDPQTGCISWDLVIALDQQGRKPPAEAVEAFNE